MRATALGLLLAVTACNLNLEGAKCRDDTNCPQQQRCDHVGIDLVLAHRAATSALAAALLELARRVNPPAPATLP